MSTDEPTGPTINDTLDQVTALWRDADEHTADAEMFEVEARNARDLAADKYDAAEQLWKPLVETWPEWEQALRSAIDPRTIEVDVDVTVNDQNLVIVQPDGAEPVEGEPHA